MNLLAVDNSVLLQAILQPTGAVGPLLHLLREGACMLVYTPNFLEEVVEVLNRPFIQEKYHLQDEDIQIIIALLHLRGQMITTEQWLNL